MSHTHSTTKRRTFKHLNAYQRGQIEAMLRLGVPKVKIAKDLGIARSTLYEEIKRGTVAQKRSDWTYYEQYFAQSGQMRYERNRENSGKPSKFNAAQDFIRYVENAILKDKHSPDAICGRAKRMNLFEVSVCTKTIYNYIAMGLLKVKNIDLRQKVRRRKRKEKKNHDDGRTLGESIDRRDPLVDERSTFGNWELDTIVGKKGTDPVLLAADERKKRKRHLIKIRAKTAEAVAEGIAKLRELYGAQFSQVFRDHLRQWERVRSSARSCSRGEGVLCSSLRTLGTWNEREAECPRSVFHSEGHGYDELERGRSAARRGLDQFTAT